MSLTFDNAKSLLTAEAIKEKLGIDLDEPGTVQIYMDDLIRKDIGITGWTEDELFEDFQAWFEDDYSDDDQLFDNVWPEETVVDWDDFGGD